MSLLVDISQMTSTRDHPGRSDNHYIEIHALTPGLSPSSAEKSSGSGGLSVLVSARISQIGAGERGVRAGWMCCVGLRCEYGSYQETASGGGSSWCFHPWRLAGERGVRIASIASTRQAFSVTAERERMKQTTTPPIRHVGLVCRECGGRRFRTVYTRRRDDGILRRKRCCECGKAITTRERRI